MWVLTGLLGLIRQEGFVPRDQQLFKQFASSLSMSLAHQSNVAAAGLILHVSSAGVSLFATFSPFILRF